MALLVIRYLREPFSLLNVELRPLFLLKKNHATFVMSIEKSNEGNVPFREVKCDEAV